MDHGKQALDGRKFSLMAGRRRYLLLLPALACALTSLSCRYLIQQAERPVPTMATPTPIILDTRTPTPTLTKTMTPAPSPTWTATVTSTPTRLALVDPGTPVPNGLAPITMESAPQVSLLAEWHESSVSDLAWMPDGRFLAVSTTDRINLYQLETRTVVRTLYPTKSGIIRIAFSPDSNWLVVGCRQGEEKTGYASSLELWRGPNWRPLGILYGNTIGLSDMVFLPDSDYLAVAYSRPGIQVSQVDFWATSSWLINTTFDIGSVLNLSISDSGQYLATSPDRYGIQVWDVLEHTFLYKLPTSFTGAVNALKFSPDSGTLATGHYDGMVRIWDVKEQKMLLEFDTGAVVQSLAYSPDGLLLATGGAFENSAVQLWSAGSGAHLRTLENPPGGISRLIFSPEANYLISASYNGNLRLWGLRP